MSGKKSKTFSDWLVFQAVPIVMVVLLVGFAILHAAVWVVSLFTAAPSPTWSGSLKALTASPSNPVAGYPFPAGPAWVVYLIAGVMAALLLATGAFLFEALRQRQKVDKSTLPKPARYGRMHHAQASSAAREALSEVLAAQSKTPTDEELVVPLGLLGRLPRKADGRPAPRAKTRPGTPLFCQHEDSTVVIAPPRSGKTRSIAAPRIIDAVGPVLATSSKADLLLLTAANRERRGGWVKALDPDGVARWPYQLRPDFVAGAERPAEALQRGKAWAAGSERLNSGGGSGGNTHWFSERAGEALAFLLHAAAVKPGGSMADVVRWSADFRDPEPIDLLESSPAVEHVHWGKRLAQLTQSRAGETTDSLAITLSGVLGPLQSPELLELLCPPPEERFDVDDFLDGPNTIYFLDEPGAVNAGPIITMVIDQVIRAAQRRSQHMPGERLWPTLRVVLDEAANMAVLDSLDSILADSGGRGIEVEAFFQNFAQMDQRWGSEAAEAIRASATTRIFLGGINEQDRARELSSAVGEYDAKKVSHHGSQTSRTTERRAILDSADIRQMYPGEALMFYRTLPGTIITLPELKTHPRYASEIYPDYRKALKLTGRSEKEIEDEDKPLEAEARADSERV